MSRRVFDYVLGEIKGFIKRRIITPKIIRDINNGQGSSKVVIGAGNTEISGWINFDLRSKSFKVYSLDASKKFPFNDEVMGHILSEHLIEHLDYDDGLKMLQESYRVLRDGGRMRISTPDLERIVALYGKDSGIEGKYVDEITNFVKDLREKGRTSSQFAINNAFYNWGHKFLYDYDLLKRSMGEAGFRNIKRYEYQKSGCDEFRDAERHGDEVKNIGMVRYESLILEGEK